MPWKGNTSSCPSCGNETPAVQLMLVGICKECFNLGKYPPPPEEPEAMEVETT